MRLVNLGIGVAVVIATFAVGVAVAADSNTQTETLTDKSRVIAAGFQDKLRTQLMGALQAGGPTNAIGACKELAPSIAQQLGASSGAIVKRTSLRVRNPNNAPDSWERETLGQFATRKAAGEALATMESVAWVDTPTGRVFRYMKAIPMAEMCNQCHGRAISPEVSAKLAESYPQDRAVGFVPGDIRGAISITWTDPGR